jgi:hypothetical protein
MEHYFRSIVVFKEDFTMIESRSRLFRLKAIACERRAIEAPDSSTKQVWVELAIEWHAISARVAVLDAT